MQISIHVCVTALAMGGDCGFVVRVFLESLRLLLQHLHLNVEVLVNLLEVLSELTVLISEVRAELLHQLVNMSFLSSELIVKLIEDQGLLLLHH